MPTFEVKVKPDELPTYVKAEDFDSAMAAAQQMKQFHIDLPGEDRITMRGSDHDNAMENAHTYLSRLPATGESGVKQEEASLLRGGANLVGVPGTVRNLIGAGVDWGAKKFGYDTNVEQALKSGPFNLPDIGQTRKWVSDMTGGFSERQPRNTAEEYIRTGGEFLPTVVTAALTGGATAPALAFDATVPALTSETLGQGGRKIGENFKRPEWMPDWAPSAETAGRIIGGLPSSGVVQKVITPNTIPDRLQRAVQTFRDRNIPIAPEQMSGAWQRGGGQDLSHMLPEQQEVFNTAANQTLGIGTRHANLDDAITAIRNDYNTITGNYSPAVTPRFASRVNTILRRYDDAMTQGTTGPTQWAAGMRRIGNSLENDAANIGHIDGAKFQTYIEDLRNLADNAQNSATKRAAIAIRNELNDLMERTIAGRPNAIEDLQAFRTMSGRYRDAMTLRDAQKAAMKKTGTTQFTPDQLSNAVSKHVGDSAFVNASTPLGDLAASGLQVMKKMPGASGPTFADSLTRAAIKVGRKASIPGLLGLLAQQHLGPTFGLTVGPAIATTAAVGEHAIGGLIKMLKNSPAGQIYRSNQLLPNTPLNASKLLRSGLPGLSIYGDEQLNQREGQ